MTMARTRKTPEPRVPPYPHPKNPNLTVIAAFKRSDGPVYEDEELALSEQAEIDEYNKNRGFLPWEYCECGCKGHELVISKDVYFWSYMPKPIGKTFVLFAGHGMSGKRLGVYKTQRDRDAALVPILKGLAEERSRTSQHIMECLAKQKGKVS
jgi:hypothetical protein